MVQYFLQVGWLVGEKKKRKMATRRWIKPAPIFFLCLNIYILFVSFLFSLLFLYRPTI
jgi:hypothetical protein